MAKFVELFCGALTCLHLPSAHIDGQAALLLAEPSLASHGEGLLSGLWAERHRNALASHPPIHSLREHIRFPYFAVLSGSAAYVPRPSPVMGSLPQIWTGQAGGKCNRPSA